MMTARGIDEEQIKRVINYGSKVKQTYGCKAVYTYISVAYKLLPDGRYKIKTVMINE
ncbi:hypothetical protein COV11_03905 [Candidatus Woesearchaeota archaeon CG10_big_fil_rev_8_21_14_0_10_30_7]|nr:MAG: hypothetical protein COV11_03905 [Candidatus Woesearchaeota archaeon CG10_big_fil_rev_8_21_14_0_10_30_7]